MQPATEVAHLTRRRLLLFIAGATGLCSRMYGFATDFWNKKAAGEWSPEEVHQLLNKSPWAKQVTAEVTRSGNSAPKRSGGGGGNSPSMGGGNSRNGAGGMGGGSSRNPTGMGTGANNRGMSEPGGINGNSGGGGGTPRPTQQFKGVVRWESAKPVQEVAKTKLPEEFAGRYVISLTGFPLGGRRAEGDEAEQPKVSKAALERIKAATSITPKGKDPAQPGSAQVVDGALLLAFSKDSIQLSPEDKEVAFVTMVGRMSIKTKFNFKEMMYHETLAV